VLYVQISIFDYLPTCSNNYTITNRVVRCRGVVPKYCSYMPCKVYCIGISHTWWLSNKYILQSLQWRYVKCVYNNIYIIKCSWNRKKFSSNTTFRLRPPTCIQTFTVKENYTYIIIIIYTITVGSQKRNYEFYTSISTP